MPSCSVCRLVLSEGRIRIITSPPRQPKQCKNSNCPAATRTCSGVHYIAGQPQRRLRVWVDEEGQRPCERPPLGGSTQLDTHGRWTPEDICVHTGRRNSAVHASREEETVRSSFHVRWRRCVTDCDSNDIDAVGNPLLQRNREAGTYAGSLSAAKSRSLKFFHPSPAFSKRHSSYITR